MNTPEIKAMDTEKICNVVDHHLSEMTDGYLVVGFNGDTGEPFMLMNAPDPKTALALNKLLLDLVAAGGVECRTTEGESEE